MLERDGCRTRDVCGQRSRSERGRRKIRIPIPLATEDQTTVVYCRYAGDLI